MQWEYAVFTLDRWGDHKGFGQSRGDEPPTVPDHGRAINSKLKKWGEDEWELVAMVSAPDTKENEWVYHAILKRPKA
jgi:hypothetical protein